MSLTLLAVSVANPSTNFLNAPLILSVAKTKVLVSFSYSVNAKVPTFAFEATNAPVSGVNANPVTKLPVPLVNEIDGKVIV